MEREAVGGFAVRRLLYHPPESDRYGRPARRVPEWDTVAVHPTFESADADAVARDVAAWAEPGFNPFEYAGPLFYVTSLPDGVLRDWLLDRGVQPPGDAEPWEAWYDRAKPDPLLVRAALDKLRFFDAAPARPRVFAVVEVNWRYNDDHVGHADAEGGNVLRAYRTRAAADAECARLNALRRAEDEPAGFREFSASNRANGHGYRYAHEADFYEVVAVDAGGPG